MPKFDRRKLLHVGVGVAFAGIPLLSGCGQSTEVADSGGSASVGETDLPDAKPEEVKPEEESEGKSMQVEYLEIVTTDADALCKQYSAIHGVTFSEPVASFGNARTAKLSGGGQIGIRGPLRDTETPVIRPYMKVEKLDEAVTAAAEAGAEIAIPRMELPELGAIAVVIQGGIECGLWEDLK